MSVGYTCSFYFSFYFSLREVISYLRVGNITRMNTRPSSSSETANHLSVCPLITQLSICMPAVSFCMPATYPGPANLNNKNIREARLSSMPVSLLYAPTKNEYQVAETIASHFFIYFLINTKFCFF